MINPASANVLVSGGAPGTDLMAEAGSPTWMTEALSMGNTGLWSILIDPKTGQGIAVANDTMLRLLGLDSHPSPSSCLRSLVLAHRSRLCAHVLKTVSEMLETGQQKRSGIPVEPSSARMDFCPLRRQRTCSLPKATNASACAAIIRISASCILSASHYENLSKIS